MYGTGVLMSLSPCALSLLPLTISYIAGTEAEGAAEEAAAGGERGGFDSVRAGFVPSAAFAAGRLFTATNACSCYTSYSRSTPGSPYVRSSIDKAQHQSRNNLFMYPCCYRVLLFLVEVLKRAPRCCRRRHCERVDVGGLSNGKIALINGR